LVEGIALEAFARKWFKSVSEEVKTEKVLANFTGTAVWRKAHIIIYASSEASLFLSEVQVRSVPTS
jgi:predicted transcriptional regulator